MHQWGDAWFKEHGNDLHTAIHFCIRNWQRWGRLGSHGKEKFGTFRHHVYYYDWRWPIHSILKPGYVRYSWGRKCMELEGKLGRVIQLMGIAYLITRYQVFIYHLILFIACKRWPHITKEIRDHL